MSSGYATPGLTGWGILDATALDVLIDFTYGLLVENADQKEKDKLDLSLSAFDAPRSDKLVEFTRPDGTVIRITEKRLAEIQSNVSNIAHMRARRG